MRTRSPQPATRKGLIKVSEKFGDHFMGVYLPPWSGIEHEEMDLTRIKSMVEKIPSLGKRAWITEMDYPTCTDYHGITEEKASEYLQNQIDLVKNTKMMGLTQGMSRTIWLMSWRWDAKPTAIMISDITSQLNKKLISLTKR
jgi:hypothetical protein